MSETLIILKPDCIRRGLMGEVLKRLERKGVRFLRMRALQMTDKHIEGLYGKFKDEDFYKRISEFMAGGLSVAGVAYVPHAIETSITTVRTLMGSFTAPQAGTIRGDLAKSPHHNIIHASDSPENAKREIEIFFPGYPGDVAM